MRKGLLIVLALCFAVIAVLCVSAKAEARPNVAVHGCQEDTMFRLAVHPKWRRNPDVCREVGYYGFMKSRVRPSDVDVWVWGSDGYLHPTQQTWNGGGWCFVRKSSQAYCGAYWRSKYHYLRTFEKHVVVFLWHG
jgi:hypothetical protein